MRNFLQQKKQIDLYDYPRIYIKHMKRKQKDISFEALKNDNMYNQINTYILHIQKGNKDIAINLSCMKKIFYWNLWMSLL